MYTPCVVIRLNVLHLGLKIHHASASPYVHHTHYVVEYLQDFGHIQELDTYYYSYAFAFQCGHAAHTRNGIHY